MLLAYDTTKLDPSKAPKTWPDLIAWIKANPGQFIYNRPDKGGSGGNFVRRAIYAANGNDPSMFAVDNYTQAKGDEVLGKAWKLLLDLAPSLMDKGAYTSGNTQSIQLLSQSAVTMIPAWSDQALSAISQGVLPETTGLLQLSDLGFPGNFAHITVPTNAANKALALKLADFILSEDVQSDGDHQARRLPGRLLGLRRAGSARQVQGPDPGLDPGLPGRRLGEGDQRRLVPQRRTERGPLEVSLAASDIAGTTQESGRPIGLLLVAIPVLLVGWMVIYPIISAVVTTLWLPDDNGHHRAVAVDLQVLLHRRLQPRQPAHHAVDDGAVRGVPARRLLADRALSALRQRPARRLCPGPGDLSALRALDHPELCLHPRARAERHGRHPAQRRPPAQDPLALPDAVGTADRPRLGPYPADRADPDLGSGRRSPTSRSRRRATSAPGAFAVFWHIILPRIGNSILVAISFSVLGIFSAFTLPYILGPAAPEMMGPFMQRTFRDLYDPTNAITQAVISFFFCIAFGLFYVRSVVKNQRGR